MLDARPYKPFKQDNVKKVTVLTADTPSKIFELKFSGVISVILTSRHEEYDFSPTRDSNIRNMALLQTTQKKKKKKKKMKWIIEKMKSQQCITWCYFLELTSNSTPVTMRHICESNTNLMSIISI